MGIALLLINNTGTVVAGEFISGVIFQISLAHEQNFIAVVRVKIRIRSVQFFAVVCDSVCVRISVRECVDFLRVCHTLLLWDKHSLDIVYYPIVFTVKSLSKKSGTNLIFWNKNRLHFVKENDIMVLPLYMEYKSGEKP